MRISLFDEEDLKAIETLLTRALVRAARVLRKEGLIGDLTQPTPVAAPPTENVPSFLRGPPDQLVRNAEQVFRQNGKMPEPQRPPEMVPDAKPPPAPEKHELTPEQFAARAKPLEKPKRRSAREVCRTQAEKPQGGWITTEEAAKIMVNGSNIDIERAKTMLGQWILGGEVAGVIVTSVKPPTKQLPGRLHVKKEDVIARDKRRQENAAVMPGPRAMAEKRAKAREQSAAA